MKKGLSPLDVVFWIVTLLATLFFVCCVVTGCMTSKNLPKHNDKFPIAAAEYAAKHFPPKETHSIDTVTNSDTLYKEGPAVDTTVFCDTLYVTKQVSLKCPPTMIIHDTAIITKTNWMIDGAATEAAELKLEKAQLENASLKEKLNWWKIACLITLGVVGITIAFKIGISIATKKL